MVEAQLDRKARQYVDESRAATSRVLRTLSVVAAGVGRVPGRKTVVLMTEGFFIEEARPALQQIAAHAARNGVTVYALDGKGGRSGAGRDLPDASTTGAPVKTSFDTAGDGPQILAGTTGGFVIRGSNDMLSGLQRIADDTSTYYVAGYAPALQKLDGSMRNIEVKSKRDGLQVRARKAYLATPLPPR
jgi:VWFA-related protein